MKKWLVGAVLFSAAFWTGAYFAIVPAHAQSIKATTVGTCGSLTYDVGSSRDVTQDSTGLLCDKGGSGGGSTTANQGTPGSVSAGWPFINGEPADTTGTFTNGTQSTAITTPSVDGYETATITINGTYGTATGTFQASDDGGTTYYTLRCARTDSVAVEAGYTSLTNTNRAWFCPIHSFDTIRVQSSAVASGTVNVRISISASPTSSGVTASISGDSTIGVEGVDGSTQASPSNPLPVSTVGSTFAPSQISLSTSAAQVLAALTNPAAREVCNIDTAIIEYVGATGVTSTTGIPVNPGQCWDASHSSAAIFAVAASATPKVAVVQY